MKNILIFFVSLTWLNACNQPDNQRKEINLNGEWAIAKTTSHEDIPSAYESKIPVPGLVDMAEPALDDDADYDNGVYWHKTNFTIHEDYPELIKLKIGKVKYGARVYVNDKYVGEQMYAFTSAEFDIKPFLHPSGESNELRVAVGVLKDMPDSVIWGRDNEKQTYIPGIYDDVKIILTGTPFIKNIQTVPQIETGEVRIVADIKTGKDKKRPVRLEYEIKEVSTGQLVAQGSTSSTDFSVEIPGFQLWSPEAPFLYSLHLSTGSDDQTVRFGMRSFAFDPATGRAMLNGKPYYMRGTNVTLLRFFEDPGRGALPWNDEWVIKLHRQFKTMNWNSIRYCIGLPPARWYEIADSLGFLIQNEYPIWTGFKGFENIYPGVTAERLANEFRAWMPEHWNHPSVVIWDAQNESITEITGKAIGMVRETDLSNRPWENGWSAPQAPDDPMETHPYLFIQYRKENTAPTEKGVLADLLHSPQTPGGGPNQRYHIQEGKPYTNPIIINEYGWLWLNRDGSTTTLTDRVYDVVFGEDLTTEQRFDIYARHLGILTEYWRAHRQCAGILHFCGLGYSRPDPPRGQTSDHFIDIENLIFEPHFVEYVRPAFSPVGLMVNFWEKEVLPGETKMLEVYAINDLDHEWKGQLTMTILNEGTAISKTSEKIQIPEYGRIILKYPVEMPAEKGKYKIVAEVEYQGDPVKSIREFSVK